MNFAGVFSERSLRIDSNLDLLFFMRSSQLSSMKRVLFDFKML